MKTPDYITKTNKQTPAVKSLISEAHSDTTSIVELMDELERLSPEEARKLVGPLVEQFYALQFKLGGVLGAISSRSRTPELTVELLMEVAYPPIPIEVSQLEEAFTAIAGGWDVDIAQLRRLGWSELRHMGEYLTQDNIQEVVQLAEENDYGSSLFRMGSDGAAIVRKQGRKAAAPAASSILTGRRLALTERAQVAQIPTQIANSLLALRHRADARRTSAKFAVRLIVAQLHGPTVSVLPTPNSEEPIKSALKQVLQFGVPSGALNRASNPKLFGAASL